MRNNKIMQSVMIQHFKTHDDMTWENIKDAMDNYYNRMLKSKKLFSAKEIRERLLKINPQVKNNSKFTNPFIHDDIKKWYDELKKNVK